MDVASPTTPKDGLSKGKPRTLTQAQRERKRAADRKSVRQARAKTKNYVAHLEQLLADTASPGDSDRTSRLLCRLNQNFTEINRLKESLAAIRDIAQTALDDGSANKDSLTRASSAALCESTCNNSADDGPSAQNGAGSHAAIEAGTEETSSSNTWPPLDIIGLASFDLADKLTLPTSLSQLSGLDTAAAGFHAPDPLLDGRLQIPPAGGKAQAPQPSSDLQCSNDTRYIWDSLGYYTLNALQSAMASAWTPDSVRDADIMITAVVHGWDAVPAKYQWLDATWQVLQHTDQHILTGCGIVERFAMLYIMKLKLHYFLTGEYLRGTPSFLHARPSQKFIHHLPHVEYYVWPGFREHLLVWPDKYCNDAALLHLRAHFQFLWPHSPHDLYTFDASNNTYAFAEEFLQRAEDIRCWTVSTDFFASYPELRGEMPVFKSVPRAISTNPLSSSMLLAAEMEFAENCGKDNNSIEALERNLLTF